MRGGKTCLPTRRNDIDKCYANLLTMRFMRKFVALLWHLVARFKSNVIFIIVYMCWGSVRARPFVYLTHNPNDLKWLRCFHCELLNFENLKFIRKQNFYSINVNRKHLWLNFIRVDRQQKMWKMKLKSILMSQSNNTNYQHNIYFMAKLWGKWREKSCMISGCVKRWKFCIHEQ